MVAIIFPGNAIALISILIPVVGFDILESFMNWELLDSIVKLFDFKVHDKIGDELFNQIIDIGYESFNSLMNLNTLGIVLFAYILKFSLWMFLMILSKTMCKSKQCKALVSNI